MLLALLAASRINRSFPDRQHLQGLLAQLDPSMNHYLYDWIEIGTRTGMPSERSLTRVQADLAMADKVCQDEEARDPGLQHQPLQPSRYDDDIHLRRYRYHRQLLETPVQPSFALSTELRWADRDRKTAFFITVLDRFDLSEELLVRYTIHLGHGAEGWTRSQVRVEDDTIELTRNFKNLVARTTAHDSELAFLLLSEVPSLTVESVKRCRIGPLYAAGMAGPAAIQALVDDMPGELILALPTDHTAIDIERDSNDDPLAIGYREFIGAEACELVEERRRQLGYRVRRQRKLVCTPGIAARLRTFLKERKTPCVVYTLARPI
jgi:hypothetical protein